MRFTFPEGLGVGLVDMTTMYHGNTMLEYWCFRNTMYATLYKIKPVGWRQQETSMLFATRKFIYHLNANDLSKQAVSVSRCFCLVDMYATHIQKVRSTWLLFPHFLKQDRQKKFGIQCCQLQNWHVATCVEILIPHHFWIYSPHNEWPLQPSLQNCAQRCNLMLSDWTQPMRMWSKSNIMQISSPPTWRGEVCICYLFGRWICYMALKWQFIPWHV